MLIYTSVHIVTVFSRDNICFQLRKYKHFTKKLNVLNKSVLSKEQRRCVTERHIDSVNRQCNFAFEWPKIITCFVLTNLGRFNLGLSLLQPMADTLQAVRHCVNRTVDN